MREHRPVGQTVCGEYVRHDVAEKIDPDFFVRLLLIRPVFMFLARLKNIDAIFLHRVFFSAVEYVSLSRRHVFENKIVGMFPLNKILPVRMRDSHHLHPQRIFLVFGRRKQDKLLLLRASVQDILFRVHLFLFIMQHFRGFLPQKA